MDKLEKELEEMMCELSEETFNATFELLDEMEKES